MTHPNSVQKSLVIYTNWWQSVQRLSMNERGELFSLILLYGNNKEPDFETNEKVLLVWSLILENLKINAERYVARCERNRKAIEKRWEKQKIPNVCNNDNKNDNNNINDNDNKNDNKNKKKDRIQRKERKFIKPTIAEIAAYCQERQNNIDAEQFFNFYEAKDWMLGKNHIKNWKCCVHTWEKASKPTKEVSLQDKEAWLKGLV